MNLKQYYDNAKNASDAAIVLKNQVDELFNNGTDEGIQGAIDLQPQLEAANKRADEANKLYLAMRDADAVGSNAAALFVAADEKQAASEDGGEKRMTRAAFQALSPAARVDFLNTGGKIDQ